MLLLPFTLQNSKKPEWIKTVRVEKPVKKTALFMPPLPPKSKDEIELGAISIYHTAILSKSDLQNCAHGGVIWSNK
jgi:hypothetical protein